jgi:hypothetical protein
MDKLTAVSAHQLSSARHGIAKLDQVPLWSLLGLHGQPDPQEPPNQR